MTRAPLVPEDLLRFSMLSELELSADGSRVAFVVTSPDAAANKNLTDVWLARTDGSEPPAARLASWAATKRPRLSPDGLRLALLADPGRTRSAGAWVVGIDGGSPVPVAAFGSGIREIAWSPDSRRLAVVSTQKSGQEVWTCKVDGTELIRVNGNLRSPAQVVWTTDGCIALLARLDGEEQPAVWSVEPDGAHSRRMTEAGFAIASFAFSPDGRLAVVQPDQRGDAMGRHRRLYVDGRSVTADLDRSLVGDVTNDTFPGQDVPRLCWSADGSHIRFRLGDRGRVHLVRLDVDGGEPDRLIGGELVVLDFDIAGDRLVYLASSLVQPPAIWTTSLGQIAPTRLFDPNPWLEERALGRVRSIGFEFDGHRTDGWVMAPPDAGTPIPPAVLHVHGGPHSAYGQVFTLLFHLLAGAGFSVILCNPPGSATYDEAYVLSLHNGWGVADSLCLLAFADHAVASGVVDGGQLGIAGTSYGGFPVLNVLARDARFKAALLMRAITDGTAIAAEAGSTVPLPIEADRIVTPLMLIIGGEDDRVPPAQSERIFERLRRRGLYVELVAFPGEGHSMAVLGRPASKVEQAKAILGWWGRHLHD